MKNMKTVLTLLLTATVLTSAPAYAGPNLCIARETAEAGYVSRMQYSIQCDDGRTFNSQVIFTTILLPLPYNWKATSKRRLEAEMTKLGLHRLARIPGVEPGALFEKGLLIYGTSQSSTATFCLIDKQNPKKIGMNTPTTVWDIKSKCDERTNLKLEYTGLTEEEIAIATSKEGLVQTGIPGIYRR